MTERDTIYLLKPGFADPAYPGQTFYCWHCALIEGVLASFPSLTEVLIVERVDWPRPRHLLVERVGEDHQALPLMTLAPSGRSHAQSASAEGCTIIEGKDAVLAALSERHGFPAPHP